MSEATSTFFVAIAGFGWWGRHIATRLQDHPWLRVAGVVEPVTDSHADIRGMGLTAWANLAGELLKDHA